MKAYYTTLALGLSILWPSFSRAQEGILEKQTTSTGAITYLRLDPRVGPKQLAQSKAVLRSLLKLRPTDELRLQRSETDELGYVHEWHKQYYQGVPVEHGLYIVQAKNGSIETLNGELKQIAGLNPVPALTEKAALTRALASIGATTYRWQVPTAESWLKTVKEDPKATFYPTGELLVGEDAAARPRLAYKFAIYATKPASAQYVYVDAGSGEVFRTAPIAQSCAPVLAAGGPGPAPRTPQPKGRQGKTAGKRPTPRPDLKAPQPTPGPAAQPPGSTTPGTSAIVRPPVYPPYPLLPTFDLRYVTPTPASSRQLVTEKFDAGNSQWRWRLHEAGRLPATNCSSVTGTNIYTYNMQRQGDVTMAYDFVDWNDNNWTAAEYDNANFDNAALDAHWGAEMTIDYFNIKHCRSSYNGNGADIKGYVHTDLPDFDRNYATNDNAVWESNLKVMLYGDGATLYQPLTSLDVVAHEIGHAFAQSMIDLGHGFSNYSPMNESAALNEGLSDIWAACVEAYAAPEKQTWKMGEDIARTAPCNRDLANPLSRNYPAVYGDPYYDNITYESHHNGSILSHWFYLLAHGGSGANNICISGIGIDNAAKIVFRAEKCKLGPTATYANARTAMIDAANEIYGSTSTEASAVTYAWSAVGVGPALAATITGPEQICGATATYQASTPMTWTASPASYFTTSSGSGTQFSTTAASSAQGVGTITGTPLGTCGPGITQTVHVGEYLTGTYYVPHTGTGGQMIPDAYGSIASDDSYIAMVFPSAPNTTYTFTPDSSPHYFYQYGSYEMDLTFRVSSPGSYSAGLTVTKTSPCGSVTEHYFIGYYYTPQFTYSILPNPSSSELTITRSSPDQSASRSATLSAAKELPFEAVLYDNYGQQVKSGTSTGGQAVFDVRNLPNGLYNLRVGQGKEAVTKHVQITH